MKQSKKLLLIGSTEKSVHIKNFYNLIKNYFDEILIIGDEEIDYCENKTINFSLKNPLSVYKNIKILKHIIANFKPTIIHVHQANTYAYFAVKANKKSTPLVLTTWGTDVLVLPHKSKLHRYIAKYGLKRANAITADANFMAKSINKLGIKTKVEIANFGIYYKNISIPEKENIIYSNRLHNDIYNISKIIDAFAIFVKKHTNWKLVIGANGNLTSKLQEQAKNILPKHSYKFIGFVNQEENKKQYLRSKIWASVPSSDGTAISLLEAMSYGCIPVLSDLPANNEWINNNQNGIINKNNLALAFEQASQLNLNQVQLINKEIILKRATKKVNREKFYSIYNHLLKIKN